MAKKETKKMVVEPLKETTLHLVLVGDSELILHGKSRYYERSEVWKQSHDKGADLPAEFKQGKNNWETLITSIHWKNPITYHDEDISLYTEEEWKDYMKNNNPCILSIAFLKSFAEAFKTFLSPTMSNKHGTDVTRAVSLLDPKYPITFDNVEAINKIVQTNGGKGKTSPVLCSYNLFYGWKCEIDVACPDNVFPPETIVSLINTTGKYVGIGTQRANGYGRYHIENAVMESE